MNLKEFRDMLLLSGVEVAQNETGRQTGDYITWALYKTEGYHADNRRRERVLFIQVDYYTKEEYPSVPEVLEGLFDEYGVAYDGPLVTYDDRLEMSRYIYDCEVVGDGRSAED